MKGALKTVPGLCTQPAPHGQRARTSYFLSGVVHLGTTLDPSVCGSGATSSNKSQVPPSAQLVSPCLLSHSPAHSVYEPLLH